ncbi:MAG: hypothetical protein Q7S15_00935 [bacterium]|nr:hypothetical protein [bacterium]
MNQSIYKAYDVRGLYPEEINEQSLEPLGITAAHIFGEGIVVVAHDGRHGSKELAGHLERTISEEATRMGKRVEIKAIGLSTTPMFYFLVNHLGAKGGLMLTASHNPKNYNGVKVVREGAVPISGKELRAAVETLLPI